MFYGLQLTSFDRSWPLAKKQQYLGTVRLTQCCGLTYEYCAVEHRVLCLYCQSTLEAGNISRIEHDVMEGSQIVALSKAVSSRPKAM